ncbi:MAG: transporter substrate-binding domain-containing protein [Bradyrhizobium sp.]|nr:MAG: transporter substrate-binding domain-containing protein [Bradyrhizobium sp.]
MRVARHILAIAVALGLAAATAAADPVAAPSFWDPNLHLERPDLSALRAIRFLTDDDYPPLNFALADGSLVGFNVEIARAICEELHIGCTIQARRWDTLIDSLETGKGDAVIASITASAATRARIDFTQPYYQTPARFVVRADSQLADTSPTALEGKSVGVLAGSAHQSYLATFFPAAIAKPYANFAALHDALRDSKVDAIFADGLSLAIWLSGEDSAACCAFKGGPFTESRYFGEGVGIAVRKEDVDLRRAMDWALARLAAKGTYAEIYLKYFPVGFY